MNVGEAMKHMQTAIIDVKFSPPDARLDGVPGLRPDPGGYVYRIRYTDGRLRICGTSSSDDASRALSVALYAARHAGFTHWMAQGETGDAHPL